jgi:dTMP kinase
MEHTMDKKGIFISIEGTDGSGKTTQIKRIEQYLKQKGYEVVLTREPGGTNISEKIRSIILDPENIEMGDITELLLYAASRAQLMSQIIKPAIDEGIIVICDRFIDSSYVYQGFGRGIPMDIVEGVNKIAIEGLLPDITFFFDIKPEIALSRRIAATGSDRIEKEKMDFHRRVYEGYQRLTELYPERIKSINADNDIESVFNNLRYWIDTLVK